MANNLRGVMPALLTPFDAQQKIDQASLRRLVVGRRFFLHRYAFNFALPQVEREG